MPQIQYLGRFLDLNQDANITYTIQAQDLADVATVASSVTTSFKLPFTLNNYEALQGLSLPSDTSRIPYQKTECRLYDLGTILINSGWLKINSSDENGFNVNIENGIVDFFKAIEGKTIGKDLDLSETNHNKDLISVINSFDRNDYCYIIADYNGLNTYFTSNTEYINVDYLVPSLNNKYLWDKIFNTIGYTYSGSVFETELFTNLWTTYPKAPPTESDDEELPDPVLRFNTNSNNPLSSINESNGVINFTPQNVTINGVLFVGNIITIQENGTYRFTGIINGLAKYYVRDQWENNSNLYEYTERIKLGYILNGVENRTIIGDIGSNELNLNLLSGDEIRLFFYFNLANVGDPYPYASNHSIGDFKEFSLNSYNINLFQISQSVIDFGNEFLDVTISEYVKEIMIRFALTPFIDVENKHINFLTLNERLQSDKLVDWTDKYVNRTNENYTYNDYCQKNWFKHKYNDENATFNNGFLSVDNRNLQAEKDLYNSKFYSYNKEITTFYNNDFTNNSFPIWNREVKETINNDNNNRTYEVKYKGLSNRFYFIRRKELNKPTNIGSQLLRIQQEVNSVKLADVKNLSYAEIMNNYADFSRVLTDTRIHDIEVFLTINDLLELDLEAIYYFSQENQYYILNRITVDFNTRISKGEFIRVKYNS